MTRQAKAAPVVATTPEAAAAVAHRWRGYARHNGQPRLPPEHLRRRA